MSITTKTGDGGKTSLLGGKRVSKASLRVNAYGDIDELSAALGWATALSPNATWRDEWQSIQRDLFLAAADLASTAPPYRLSDAHISALEARLEALQDQLPPQRSFILPGGSPCAAALHLARTICRRAERSAVALSESAAEPGSTDFRETESIEHLSSGVGAKSATESVSTQVIVYLNRLSDYLFLAARAINLLMQVDDVELK